MTKYLITTKFFTAQGEKYLCFRVDDYSSENGEVRFRINTGQLKIVSLNNCQIEEIDDDK